MQSSTAPAKEKRVFTKEEGLSSAIELCDLAGMEMLIEAGADVNSHSDSGMTPLMRAACTGKTHLIQKLLESGADLNAKRSDGFTALSFAAFFGHLNAVRLLLASGADVSAKSKFGTSAEMWARARGFGDVVEVLRQVAHPEVAHPVQVARPKVDVTGGRGDGETQGRGNAGTRRRGVAKKRRRSGGISSRANKKPTILKTKATIETTPPSSSHSTRETETFYHSAESSAGPSQSHFDVAELWAGGDLEPTHSRRAPTLPEAGLEYLPEVAPPDVEMTEEVPSSNWSWPRLALVTILVMLVCGLATFAILELVRNPDTNNVQQVEASSVQPTQSDGATPTEPVPSEESANSATEPVEAQKENVVETRPKNPTGPVIRSWRPAFETSLPSSRAPNATSSDRIITLSTADGLGVEDATIEERPPAPITVESSRPRAVTASPRQDADRQSPSSSDPIVTERPKRKVIPWP